MNKREYKAYLLRLWRENPDKPWRASLKNPNSDAQIGFSSLNELVKFLENKYGKSYTSPTTGSKNE
ncbi:MAG: hypothetical protein HN975_16390 [Anaerolineae bacterium]|jgi:hypothetical protein|nr:hypothetical protein [Anaerolineae bacterium]MBT7072459.1 hypothetical protein [Anaerolineae bacterium]MBT7989335.1 hypothetical protein [Anaerolineae bacterium]